MFLVCFLTTLFIRLGAELSRRKKVDPRFRLISTLELASIRWAGRSISVRHANGALAYNAQRFTDNHHLGDDLMASAAENSDLNDPIYAVADGRVLFARDGGPMGNIVIHAARLPRTMRAAIVQSYYGHVGKMPGASGEDVRRGQQMLRRQGQRRYFAHLHFEMREFTHPSSVPATVKIPAAASIRAHSSQRHRGAPDDDVDGRR